LAFYFHIIYDVCRSVDEPQLSYFQTQRSRFADGSDTPVCCVSPADSFFLDITSLTLISSTF